MHAAVELADELGAVALVIPTATGGAARACAKYRRKLPIIALAHDARGWPTSSRSNGASTRRTCRPPSTSTS